MFNMALLFLCLPTRKRSSSEAAKRKGTRCPVPLSAEFLALLVVDGTLETHRLWRFRHASVLFRQHLRCSAGQNRAQKRKKSTYNIYKYYLKTTCPLVLK